MMWTIIYLHFCRIYVSLYHSKTENMSLFCNLFKKKAIYFNISVICCAFLVNIDISQFILILSFILKDYFKFYKTWE